MNDHSGAASDIAHSPMEMVDGESTAPGSDLDDSRSDAQLSAPTSGHRRASSLGKVSRGAGQSATRSASDTQQQLGQPQQQQQQQQQMHVCRLCDKLLSSSSSLDRHMLTHSGERPFVCKRCQMTFTTNGNMHRHMRTHLHKDSLARQQQLKSLGTSVGLLQTPPSDLSVSAPVSVFGTTHQQQHHQLPQPQHHHQQQLHVSAASDRSTPPLSSNGCDLLVRATNSSPSTGRQLALQQTSQLQKQPHHLPHQPTQLGLLNLNLAQQPQSTSSFSPHLVGRHFGLAPFKSALTRSADQKVGLAINEAASPSLLESAAFMQTNALGVDTKTLLSSLAAATNPNDQLGLDSVKAVVLAAAAAAAAAVVQQQHHHQPQQHQNQFSGALDLVEHAAQSSVSLVSDHQRTRFSSPLNLVESSQSNIISNNNDIDQQQQHTDNQQQHQNQQLRCKRRKQVNPRSNRLISQLVNQYQNDGANKDCQRPIGDQSGDDSEVDSPSRTDLHSNSSRTDVHSSSSVSPLGNLKCSDLTDSIIVKQNPDHTSTPPALWRPPSVQESPMSLAGDNDQRNDQPEDYNNNHRAGHVSSNKQSANQACGPMQPVTPLTTLNGEVIEDISQSYVKTANPNAARKGGKRNRHCYKCKLCTYSSVDRCTLVRHLRIHSGERPYICGICRYAFTTKANCERHVRKRHKKQYNSLGGAGGGGVKGSNGGGRSLIITDHSNHQTIPMKVNPVAAQTISQTLQRIQEKQQQLPNTEPSLDLEINDQDDLDIEDHEDHNNNNNNNNNNHNNDTNSVDEDKGGQPVASGTLLDGAQIRCALSMQSQGFFFRRNPFDRFNPMDLAAQALDLSCKLEQRNQQQQQQQQQHLHQQQQLSDSKH